MNTKTNIVYFLDNTEMSIIEIENETIGLKDNHWLIHYKSNKTVNFFKFHHSGSLRIQERYIKRGFLKGSKNNRKYFIEIDNLVVSFKEKKLDQISETVRSQINLYLNNFIL